jgi:putative ABC transport system substrate-binding protein
VLGLVAAGAAVVTACGSSGGGGGASTSPSGSPSATKTFKVGITQIVTHPALDACVAGFKEELAAKGYVEGKNITYDFENANGDMSTAATIAQKFAGEGLNLIYSVATPTSQAVAKATTSIPIVFCAVTDPVAAGLVTDVNAPSGNITGVSDLLTTEALTKHLELIKQIVPNVKTVGLLYNAGEANSVVLVKSEAAVAAKMGLQVAKATAASPAEVQAAAQSLVGRCQAVSVLTDNTVVSALSSVVKVCEQNHLPLIAADTDSVKGGAVAAWGFQYQDLGKQAGDIAAQILGGTAVKDIPVEYAKNLQLAINEKSAQAMGVTIPASLAGQATYKY